MGMPRAKSCAKDLYDRLMAMAEFTPAEQECISNKIPVLVDEGMDQEQAIAVAISKCAPDKAKGARMARVNTEPGISTAMGYRATRNEDGSLTVHNVPIFVECKRGEREFGMDWLNAAVRRAESAEEEGYLPPLHVRHHEGSPQEDVMAAGVFRVRGTQRITFKGKPRVAVMADLIITNPAVQEEVLSKRLPYRSVEIFDVDNPNLDGLALLDHEAPFLELPMLVVNRVDGRQNVGTPQDGGALEPVAGATFKAPWHLDAMEDSGPVVACFSRGRSAHFLMEADMPKPDDNKAQDTEATRKPDETFQDDGDKREKDDGEDMQDGEGALDVKAIVKAIADGSISIADFAEIKAAMEAAESETTEEEPAAPEDPAAATPGAEAMKRTPISPEAFAKVQGKADAAEAALADLKAERVREGEVAEAMQRLDGRALGSDLKQRLLAFHQEHGTKAFKAYVDTLATSVPRQPSDRVRPEDLESHAADLPEVALKFQKQGVDAVERAAKFCREWEALSASGHTRMSQERYVEINMAGGPAAFVK